MAVRRSYAGGAKLTKLASPMTEVSTFATTTPIVGWPDYTVGPFAVVIDRGGPHEEKVLCTEWNASSFQISQRGYDGTAPQAHSATETCEHVITSLDASEPNFHLTSDAGVHGLGALEDVVGETKVQTLTGKTMDGTANTFTNIPQSAVVGLPTIAGSANPPGTVIMYAGTGAIPGHWLMCNGQSVLRSAYPLLFAAIGTTYGSVDGTHFSVPSLNGKFVRATTGVPDGATAGADTVTLATGNLPAHLHAISAHDHGVDSHVHAQTIHTHTTPALTHPSTGGAGARVHSHRVDDADGDGGTTGTETAGVTVTGTSSDRVLPTAGAGGKMVTSTGTHTHAVHKDTVADHTHTMAQHAAGVTGSSAAVNTGATTANVQQAPATSTGQTGSGTSFSVVPAHMALRFLILAQ